MSWCKIQHAGIQALMRSSSNDEGRVKPFLPFATCHQSLCLHTERVCSYSHSPLHFSQLGTCASLPISSLVTITCRLLLRTVHIFKHVHNHFLASRIPSCTRKEGGREEEATPVTGVFVVDAFHHNVSLPVWVLVICLLLLRHFQSPFFFGFFFGGQTALFLFGELISPFCPPLLWSFMLRTIPPIKTLLQRHFFW